MASRIWRVLGHECIWAEINFVSHAVITQHHGVMHHYSIVPWKVQCTQMPQYICQCASLTNRKNTFKLAVLYNPLIWSAFQYYRQTHRYNHGNQLFSNNSLSLHPWRTSIREAAIHMISPDWFIEKAKFKPGSYWRHWRLSGGSSTWRAVCGWTANWQNECEREEYGSIV